MTDFDRLLAAIRANPGEDAPRLVLADWLAGAGRELEAIMQRIIAQPGEDRWRLDYAAELERMAGTVACGACKGRVWPLVPPPDVIEKVNTFGVVTRYAKLGPFKAVMPCSACHGTGRVSDGRAELAEFVRVQVELAARDDERCRCRECQPTGQHHNGPCRSPLKPLRRRERELWPAVRGAFAGEGWVACLEDSSFGKGEATSPGNVIVLVSRGFPAIVRCTLGQWRGGECENCGGFGEFRRRHDNGDGPEGPCPDCGGKWNSGPHDDPDDYWDKGTGLTPGIGPRLAQRWPIERVEVSDKTAWRSSSPHFWSWWNEDHSSGAVDLDRLAVLPPSVFFKLASWGSLNSNMYREYDSEAAARTALSDALIAWARGQCV